jgi:serine/threonine protein kinase
MTHQHSIVSDPHCAPSLDPMPPLLQQATAGSPHYMAPELFHPGAVYSFASDLWALGVVLHECFAGAQPFRRELFADLQRDIESTAAPPLKGGIQPALDRAPPWAATASLLPSLGLRLEAACETDRHDLWPLLKWWWCAMHRCQPRVSGSHQPAAGQESGDPHGLGAAAGEHPSGDTPSDIDTRILTMQTGCQPPWQCNAACDQLVLSTTHDSNDRIADHS